MSSENLLGALRDAMAKQKAMSIMLSIALVVLGSLVMKNVSCQTSGGVSTVSSSQSIQPAPMLTSAIRDATRVPKVMPPEVAALLTKVGRDNPFSRPLNQPVGLGARAPGILYLQGIIWDGEQPLAIINDAILGEGDLFEGKTLVEIGQEQIVFEVNGEREVMTLREDSEEKGLAP